MLPKISIVTPSFNQGRFIEETLRSVLDQGYDNLEYIVIDGGSNDESVEIIRRHENQLDFWVSEGDEGHAHALEKGFARSSGEIMAWLNSDDKYTPWSLKTAAEIFSRFPQVDWIVGFNSWWNQDGAMTHAARGSKNVYDFLLGNYSWIQQESVFWRRSLWDKAGGCINRDYKFMVDGELWSRFFQHAELYSVDCILGGYRFHGANRAAHNVALCDQEMERAIAAMRTQCSARVLANYRLLRPLRFANRYLFGKSRVFSKLVGSVVPDVRYRNIRYKGGAWVERTLPFNLR